MTKTYETLYRLLKENYKFSPCLFTLDFQHSNIKDISNVFCNNNDDKCVIVTCFFHLAQCWWRKALALGLRKKKYVETTRVLIFNFKMLPVKEEEDEKRFYNKIKIMNYSKMRNIQNSSNTMMKHD